MDNAETVREAWKVACPACGDDARLSVTITTTARLYASGTDADGDHEWDDASSIRCDCGEWGTVAEFKCPDDDQAGRFAVFTRIGLEWADLWSEDGRRVRFHSRRDAKAALRQHFADMTAGGVEFSARDYRIKPCEPTPAPV